jgi:hypothetical protein
VILVADSAAQRKKSRLPQHESKDALIAFADYVELQRDPEADRGSLRELHEKYRRQSDRKPPTRRLKTLEDWSAAFHWQERLEGALNEAVQNDLDEAARLDAHTFVESSRIINKRMHYSSPGAISTWCSRCARACASR